MRTSVAVIGMLAFAPLPGEAQALVDAEHMVGSVAIDGPAPPVAPATIARDSEGRITVRATRLRQPFVLDGRLDEEVYTTVPSFGDFIQQEPHADVPATNKTEIWVFFDNKNVYVAARFWTPPSDIVSNEMRRDDSNIYRNGDNFGILLDTFYDRRSAYYLTTNPQGSLRDGLLPDEMRNANFDFNLVWDVQSRRFDSGWTTEVAIPFKSLRYPQRRDQIWGFNLQWVERKRNETSNLTSIPASYGAAGIFKVSSAATLVGIEAPASGAGILDVKPYALSSVSTDRQASPAISNNVDGSFGVDAKYKITKSLNFDATYNTDFAQVEVDTQQLNLTRFSLFYPEKRDFFLESQANFNFGSTFGTNLPGNNTPVLYFSRQIGLANGLTVPIVAGGRLIGRAGPYSVGVMGIRTKDAPEASAEATTFSVARIRRDVLRRSTIGIIATDRRPATAGNSNQVVGVDANLRFFQNVEVSSYYTRSRTPSLVGNEASYSGLFRYSADLYGAEVAHLTVGDAFNPEIGFLTRHDFRRNYGFLRFSRRPKNFLGIRKMGWEVAVDDITSTKGVRQTRLVTGAFRVNANNSDEINAVYTHTDDRPQAAFTVTGARIQSGAYRFGDTRLTYAFGPQRPVVGTASLTIGDYYGGHKTEAGYTGRVSVTPQVAIEPIITFTWLEMPQGHFRAQLMSIRPIYTWSPRVQMSTLLQYSSTANSLAMNARFRWEYKPGSDLYVVYTDGRNTLPGGFPVLLRRSLAIKFTHLLQL